MPVLSFVSPSGAQVRFDIDSARCIPLSLFGLTCAAEGDPWRALAPALICLPGARCEGAGDFRLLTVETPPNRLLVRWQVGKTDLQLETAWDFDPATAALTRRDKLTNTGAAALNIRRFLPQIGFQPGKYELYSQRSHWVNENQGAWLPLHAGSLSLTGEGGRTTQGSNPFACLRLAGGTGGLVLHLLPRGNWLIRIRQSPTMHILAAAILAAGLADDDLDYPLAPGETLAAPEWLLLPLTNGEPESAAPLLHRHVHTAGIAGTKTEPPVVYNTWLDQHDNLYPERLRAQLEVASQVGCEAFVIDAGWFGAGGGDWYETAGDWEESSTHGFKGQMKAFADEVRAAGLGFGIWMEPERAGSLSRFRTQHPDWLRGARLDLENPLVYDHLDQTIRRVLDAYQAAYIKIDFNFEPGYDHRGKELTGYYAAWYQLVDNLRRDYPAVYFEGCSSGGMRFDLETLRHFDMHFLSDTVNPLDILRLGEGALLRLPPGKIGRWAVLRSFGRLVADYPRPLSEATEKIVCRGAGGWQFSQVFETADLDLIALAAVPGVFGISGDLVSLEAASRSRLAGHVAFFKQWRAFISGAHAHLLTPVQPVEERSGWSALQLCHPGRAESLVFAYRLQDVNRCRRFPLRGLDPQRLYTVRLYPEGNQPLTLASAGQVNSALGTTRSGAELMNLGLEINLPHPGTAVACILAPIG